MSKLRQLGTVSWYITAMPEQPRCCYCNKPIARYWQTGWPDGENPAPTPKVGEPFPASRDNPPGPIVLEVKEHPSKYRGRWMAFAGQYRVYGSKEAPFCRLACAALMGVSAVRAGYRVTRGKP